MLCGCSIAIADTPAIITPYSKTYTCPIASIHVNGERCESEYNCPNISLSVTETVTFETKARQRVAIRPLDVSFPDSKRILRDEGSAGNPRARLYVVSRVYCLPKQKIGILYWGGGNCRTGCENYVTYSLGPGKNEVREILYE
jgi:hypothetical protein